MFKRESATYITHAFRFVSRDATSSPQPTSASPCFDYSKAYLATLFDECNAHSMISWFGTAARYFLGSLQDHCFRVPEGHLSSRCNIIACKVVHIVEPSRGTICLSEVSWAVRFSAVRYCAVTCGFHCARIVRCGLPSEGCESRSWTQISDSNFG